ncbi:MAG: hypothetical protein ABI181_14640 [Mycobacteriaceae bacterium]
MTPLLRAPAWLRALLILFLVAWLGLITYLALSATAGSRAILAVLAVAGAVLVYRLFRLGVAGDAEHLVVRNQLRTLTYRREDVEQFRTGKPVGQLSFSRSIYVITSTDGIVAVDVTTRPNVLSRSRQKMRDDLETCESWRTESPG